MAELRKWYGTKASTISQDERTIWYMPLGIYKKKIGYLVAEVDKSGDLTITDNTLNVKHFLVYLNRWGYKEFTKAEANKLNLYHKYYKTGIIVKTLELA